MMSAYLLPPGDRTGNGPFKSIPNFVRFGVAKCLALEIDALNWSSLGADVLSLFSLALISLKIWLCSDCGVSVDETLVDFASAQPLQNK